ncbi:MAG TPA: 2,3-bisphosphoglycerate-independent phosphoglycerate mutase [Nitrospiraceae bacterium]|nr:2,3-bisphosphoglycerate-independent phosphoglycerate mutase [Nitrospiraceae bacterium]
MKYVLLHGDGIADVPHQDLGGKTPLQAAATPNLDALAGSADVATVTIQADGLVPNSDVTALAMLGYDPRKSYPGPAPFEAAGMGVIVGEHDVVFRCNMVTLRSHASKGTAADIKKLGPSVVMDDATAGGLDNEEARELIDAINEQLGSETIQFYAGLGHRHLMAWVNGKVRSICIDPTEIVGRSIGDALPTGDGSDILRKLMDASLIILRDHPVNDQRREAGLKPAHCVWLWGQGRAPQLISLTERYAVTGSIVSASDVHRGIGISAGLDAVDRDMLRQSDVSEYQMLGETAVRELGKKDFVYLHAQVPPDVAHASDPKAKIKIIEEFDQRIIGPLAESLGTLGAYRLLFVCDQTLAPGTPLGTPTSVPYLLAEGASGQKTDARRFTESAAEKGKGRVRDATKLIARLLTPR